MPVSNEAQALGYLLNNTAGIIAITSTRIYFGEIPETVFTLPTINYFLVSAPNLDTQTERRRYQISCRAKDPFVCLNLAHQVRAALNNYQGTQSTFDINMIYYDDTKMIREDNNIYHCPVDVFITFDRV
jgi:hypothetical protein